MSGQRRDKLVSEQCNGSERGREKVVATGEKAEYRCSVRMIHCDCWRRIMINRRKPCASIEDGGPKSVTIVAKVV